jgi:hypothetical protein
MTGAGAETVDAVAPLELPDEPPPDRFCDLILTGGVADGVVYPWAIMEIAREYRFRSIGGTSVGAMAAALTAAAEYRRRHGSVLGFNEVVRKLPGELAKVDEKSGDTSLFRLFQPPKKLQRLFTFLVWVFGSEGQSIKSDTGAAALRERPRMTGLQKTGRFLGWLYHTFRRLFWQYKCFTIPWALAGFFIVFFPTYFLVCFIRPDAYAWSSGVGFGFGSAALLFLALVLPIARAAWDVYYELPRNSFGLCKGGHGAGFPKDQKSLVEWLYEGVQGAAGKPLDEPLTFEDLWDAPGGPQATEGPLPRREKPRSIDLRVVSTNVSHGRPYQFPPESEGTELYF